EIPREWEVSAGAPPTRSVDLVYGIGAGGDSGHGIGVEPGSVWTILVVFVSAEEMPIAIPVFGPGMIAFLLGPLGNAGDAGGNADRAAGINEDDREAGAGCFALLDGFGGTLIVAFASGVVVNVDAFEQITIQNLSCFACGFAIANNFARTVIEVAPPFITR